MIKTPVAIIVYNRPDLTRRLIERISGFQFSHLIFIADGPRSDEDKQKCAQVRELISREWGCEVDYLFSESNLGCKNRVISGLDFVFHKHPSAIILEDDCLPAESFFEFCELMLERYKDDNRILMVSGTVLCEPENYKYSYFYSQIPHIWGWATWRDRWQSYPRKVSDYQKLYELKRDEGVVPEPFLWSLCDNLKKIDAGMLDTWDFQMTYLAISQNLLSIFPSVNLISNIGFDEQATHTKRVSILSDLPVGKIDKNILHPPLVSPFVKNDLERMLLEGYAGKKWHRLIKVLRRKNGIFHTMDRLKQAIWRRV